MQLQKNSEMATKCDNALKQLVQNDKMLAALFLDEKFYEGPAARCLLILLYKAQLLFPFIQDQVRHEFVAHVAEPDAILRGNCVVTRVMTCFCSTVGAPWFAKCMRRFVKLLMAEKEVWQTDVTKMTTGSPEERQVKAEKALLRITDVATLFLKRIQSMLASAPPEIRCLVFIIWAQATQTHPPEKVAVLLGGFLFLRVFNPGLIRPDSIRGLVRSGDPEPGAVYKQNAIALCRVLQNLSNKKTFNEGHMQPANDWLKQNSGPLELFLLDMAQDPACKEGGKPFDRWLAVRGEGSNLFATLTQMEWDLLHQSLLASEKTVTAKMATLPIDPLSLKQTCDAQRSRAATAGETNTPMPPAPLEKNKTPHKGLGLFRSASGGHSHLLTGRPTSAPTLHDAVSASRTARPVRARRESSGSSDDRPSTRGRSTSYTAGDDSEQNPNVLSAMVFFGQLDAIPMPMEYMIARYRERCLPIVRDRLVAGGLVTEAKRISLKLPPVTVELLLRVAQALQDRNFGLDHLNDGVFSLSVFIDWAAKWLYIEDVKEAEYVLNLMIKCNLLLEKGTRAARAYKLDNDRTDEMAGLIVHDN